MSETTCPACDIEMEQIEKTTFTGREMREYQCPRCKRTQIVDCGEALWKILSDANQPPDASAGREESGPPERQANSLPEPTPRNLSLPATLLSSVVPGAGQAVLGQKLRAAFFIAGTVAFYLMCWPLRLPVHYKALWVLSWIIFGLCLLSGCAALLSDRTREQHPSKWWLLVCLLLATMATLGYTTVAFWVSGFKAFDIPTRSMEYTVFVGDYVMADARYYRSRAPAQGDVVIFRIEGTFAIMRVIAAGGSTIQGRNGLVYVNRSQPHETYAHHPHSMQSFESWRNDFGPVTIPQGKLFVMGDNRDVSLDSRSPDIGMVDVKDVVAKALYVIAYRPRESPDKAPAIPESTNRVS